MFPQALEIKVNHEENSVVSRDENRQSNLSLKWIYSSESYPMPAQFTAKIISLSVAISLYEQKFICI